MKRYTKNHEWIALEGDVATIGISKYAAEQMGEVVFVELPEVGCDCTTGDGIAVLESVKSASEVYAPCSGKIMAVNDSLSDDPELVNREPEQSGWLFKLQISEVAAAELEPLMDQVAYQASLE